MSLPDRRQRTRVGVDQNVAQSLNYNQSSSTSSLKSLSSMPTFCSALSPKKDDVIRMHFENFNSLNVKSKAWKFSYKCRRLRKLWGCCQVNLINLAETQINPALLSNENEFKDNLFRLEINNTIFVKKNPMSLLESVNKVGFLRLHEVTLRSSVWVQALTLLTLADGLGLTSNFLRRKLELSQHETA